VYFPQNHNLLIANYAEEPRRGCDTAEEEIDDVSTTGS